MQSDNIIEKARQLGLNTGNSSSSADNLRTIASQVGLSEFNSMYDLNKLENILDQRLSEARDAEKANISDIEQLDNGGPIRNEKFGQKEYDKAKKDGVYDSNHYKAKQQELDKKAEELNQERQKNWKMKNGENGPVKADGSNTKRKSKMDRVMDNLNYAKAKKDAITNKIDEAKANTYNALHPVEHAKNLAESKAKNAINQAKKQVGNKAKMAAKAAGKKIVAFIAANPWVLIVLGIILAIIIIVLVVASSNSGYGHFKEECNYNLATINLTTCNTEEVTSVGLKDYVIGVTNQLILGRNYSDNAIQAIMIIVKTNALAYGGYDNTSKILELDTCTYDYQKVSDEKLNELYSDIENYLYLPNRFDDTITTLDSDVSLALDNNTLGQINELSDESLTTIFDNIYNISSPDESSTKNIFIGDSRIHGMKNAGVISDKNTIYEDGQGYDWFVETAINEANNLMTSSGRYNIFIWLGINDFSLEYVEKYAELANNEWHKHKIYVMSVGPVDEEKSGIKNSNISEYNEKIANMISSKNISNLKYYNISYDISNYDSTGLHYSNSDYRKIYGKMFGKSGNSGSGYSLYNLASYCEFVETKQIDYKSSYCSTSTSDANLLTFINTLEGVTGYCDNSQGYIATDIGDGTVSIGAGITNHNLSSSSVASYIEQNNWDSYFTKSGSGYRVNVGDCVPVSVIDKIKVYSLDTIYASPIDAAAASVGISLTQFQKDAITSFNYNVGPGYTEKLLSVYATDGYQGLWEYMKQFTNPEKFSSTLKKRRKAEFALFVTGDYTDEGKFYSRSIGDYDNYDSEGIMAKEAECKFEFGGNIASGFAVPLSFESGFVCTSPFGYRIHPIDKTSKLHSGIDLGVAQGTPVYASKDGVVEKVLNDVTGSTPSSGNMVRIRHEDGMKTDYYHMKYHSVVVNVGDEVRQGQKIGEVGSTGASTGAHLHFTIFDISGKLVDPYNYIDLSPLGDKVANCHR